MTAPSPSSDRHRDHPEVDDDATIVPDENAPDRDPTPTTPGVTRGAGVLPETLPTTPPVEVPNHALIRCLGTGGFGQVWLGRHRLTEHYRACKLIHLSHARELEGLRRIKRDVVAHPGLVPIEEVGMQGEWLYCLMPLADSARVGQAILEPAQYQPSTLHLRLRRDGRVTPDEALAIAIQLAEAIEHLHRHGVMHGDIKPANVLRLNGRWALADYGLAGDIDAAQGVGGTPGYLPPEGPGTAKADQFAFGVLLREMIVTDDASTPIAARLLEIAQRATATRPEDRFASIADLSTALATVRGQSASRSASPPSSPASVPPSAAGIGVVQKARDAAVDFWVALRHGGETPTAWRRTETVPTEESPSPPVDPAAISCAHCGYALRGTPADGRCPECALPVAESMRAAGVWNVRRLKQVILSGACVAAMLPAWLLIGIVPYADPSATAAARTIVAGSIVIYASLLTIAAVTSVHAGSRQSLAKRRLTVGVIGGIGLTPAVALASQLIIPSQLGDAVGTAMLATITFARLTLLVAMVLGMRAAARAISAQVVFGWTIALWLTVVSVLPWAFITLAPRFAQDRHGQERFAFMMILIDSLAGLLMAALAIALIVAARRRLRAMRGDSIPGTI